MVLIIGGIQTILQGIIKTLQVQNFWKIIVFCLYVVSLGFTYIFGFYFNWKLTGVWMGWLIGIVVLFVYEIRFLINVSWEEVFNIVRDKYVVIKENIRASRI
jgi:Na+-driven multidrug efflux pump